MFDIMIKILIYSFYISIVLWAIILLFRVFIAIKSDLNIKEKVLTVILPCNIGVFAYIKNELWLKITRLLIVGLCVTSFLASLFLLNSIIGFY
ncbi:hypothetical protein KHQ89_04225 [Mycoplasmatota bacterium]|nr:hypothetical protein KHQ89_04225 [Mycoplasmatota bacterium]